MLAVGESRVLPRALARLVSVAVEGALEGYARLVGRETEGGGDAVGKALGGATIATLQGTVILLFAPIAGVSLSPAKIILLIFLMFVFAISLTSLGILVASRIRSMEGFQVVMQLLLFPLLFLSGALFPPHDLPLWLSATIRLNPVSYGVDSLRQVALSSTDASYSGITVLGHSMSTVEDVAVVALFGSIMIGLAVWSFGRQE